MKKKKCSICGQLFLPKDLYPISMIAGSVLQSARETYPELEGGEFVCLRDFRHLYSHHYTKILLAERGELSEIEKDVLDSIGKHEILADNVNEQFEEQLTFGQRVADGIASFGGSWTFILSFIFVIVGWVALNSAAYLTDSFDPYPYILLNLLLSCLAALQAPVIMMSQNRQAAKDRLAQENDYRVNLKAELQIRQLNSRLELFMKHHWESTERGES